MAIEKSLLDNDLSRFNQVVGGYANSSLLDVKMLAALDDTETFFAELKYQIIDFTPADLTKFLLSTAHLGMTFNDPLIKKNGLKAPILEKIAEFANFQNEVTFNEHELTAIIWALHHLKIDLEDDLCQHMRLKTILLTGIAESANFLSPQELANVILSLAHLKIYLPNYSTPNVNDIYYSLKKSLLDNFVRYSQKDAPVRFKHQEIANITWAFANFSFCKEDKDFQFCRELLLQLIIEYSMTEDAIFKPQEVSSIIWSLPKLNINFNTDSDLLQTTLFGLISRNIDHFGPQSLSNILLGLSKVDYRLHKNEELKQQLLSAIARIAQEDENAPANKRFIPQHISNILTSLYKLGVYFNDPAIQAINLEQLFIFLVITHAPRMNAQGVSNTLNSLANLKLDQARITQAFKSALINCIARNLHDFTLQGVVNTLRSFAKLNIAWKEIQHLNLMSLLIKMLRNPNIALKIQEATQIKYFQNYYHLHLPQDCQRLVIESLKQPSSNKTTEKE